MLAKEKFCFTFKILMKPFVYMYNFSLLIKKALEVKEKEIDRTSWNNVNGFLINFLLFTSIMNIYCVFPIKCSQSVSSLKYYSV